MIVRFQQGGGLPPFVSHTPVNQAQEATPQPQPVESQDDESSKKSKSDDNKGELTKKDFFNMLKEIDGLPNDMGKIFNDIDNIFEEQELYEGTKQSNNSLFRMSTMILQKIKNAKFNKSEFDKSYAESKAKDSLAEIAITPFGKMVVKDQKGQMREVTTDEYYKNRDSLIPVTNSQLLTMRAQDPRLTFNNNILQTVENGIGMSKVQELIKAATVNLGHSKESQEGYANTNPDVQKGIEFLQDAAKRGANTNGMSIPDLYKAKYLTSNQAQQAQLAIQYILRMLPTNARTLLEFKTGNAKGVEQLITATIMSQTSNDFDFELDSESKKASANGKGSGDGSDDSTDAGKLSPVTRAILGDGDPSVMTFSPGVGNLGMEVNVTSNPIVDGDGNSMGQISMDKLMQSGYSGALDTRNATMGGQAIDASKLRNVIIEDGKINMGEWIIDKELASKGIISPDLKLVEKQQAIMKEIKKQNLDPHKKEDIEKINNLYTKANLPIKYNADGSIKFSNYQRFAMFQTVTLSKAFKHPDQLVRNKWADELQDDEEEDMLDMFADIRNKKKDDMDYDKNNWYDFNGHDSMYRGIVFMPVSNNVLAAMSGDKTKLTSDQRNNIRAHQYQADNMIKFKPQGGLDS